MFVILFKTYSEFDSGRIPLRKFVEPTRLSRVLDKISLFRDRSIVRATHCPMVYSYGWWRSIEDGVRSGNRKGPMKQSNKSQPKRIRDAGRYAIGRSVLCRVVNVMRIWTARRRRRAEIRSISLPPTRRFYKSPGKKENHSPSSRKRKTRRRRSGDVL